MITLYLYSLQTIFPSSPPALLVHDFPFPSTPHHQTLNAEFFCTHLLFFPFLGQLTFSLSYQSAGPQCASCVMSFLTFSLISDLLSLWDHSQFLKSNLVSPTAKNNNILQPMASPAALPQSKSPLHGTLSYSTHNLPYTGVDFVIINQSCLKPFYCFSLTLR